MPFLFILWLLVLIILICSISAWHIFLTYYHPTQGFWQFPLSLWQRDTKEPLFSEIFSQFIIHILFTRQVFFPLHFAKLEFSRLKSTSFEGVPIGNWQDKLGSWAIMLPKNKVDFLTNKKQNQSLSFSPPPLKSR